ncbi:hypothetical protein M3Y95_00303600 [Aphelenchoides besseyi]|nr:hypothetical protein M3Y95_00303600 [Aphelenchoides besseyi]
MSSFHYITLLTIFGPLLVVGVKCFCAGHHQCPESTIENKIIVDCPHTCSLATLVKHDVLYEFQSCRYFHRRNEDFFSGNLFYRFCNSDYCNRSLKVEEINEMR